MLHYLGTLYLSLMLLVLKCLTTRNFYLLSVMTSYQRIACIVLMALPRAYLNLTLPFTIKLKIFMLKLNVSMAQEKI